MSETKTTFSKRLESARSSRGWSQSDLAERSGLQPSAVSHYENGRREPSLANLLQISDALSVSLDWLLGRMLEDHGAYRQAKRLMQAVTKMSERDAEAFVQMGELLANKKKLRMNGCTE